jgi:hypothetical protein
VKVLVIFAVVGAFVALVFVGAVVREVLRRRAEERGASNSPLAQMFAANRAANEARRAEAAAAMPDDDPLRPWVARGGAVGWIGFSEIGPSVDFGEEVGELRDAVRAVQYSADAEPNLKKLPTPGIPFGVDLSGTPVSNRLLNVLAEHPGLAALNLFNHLNVTDDSLKVVGRMTDLQALELRVTEVTGRGIGHLRALAALRYLSVAVSTDFDQALRGLREMTQLLALVGGSEITDKGLRGLAPLVNLRHLELGWATTDQGLPSLSAFGRLMTLKLSSVQVTDAGLAAFPEMGALQRLELMTGDEGVRGSGLIGLTRMPELRELRFARNAFTGVGFEHFAALARLVMLDLSYNPITDNGLARLQLPPRVEHLALAGTKVTDAGIARLELPPSVARLYLSDTALTDASVPHLARFDSLRYVNVMGTKLTLPGAERLSEALPDCTIQTSFPK